MPSVRALLARTAIRASDATLHAACARYAIGAGPAGLHASNAYNPCRMLRVRGCMHVLRMHVSWALFAGQLYDPETELICGLRPAHFITLATPHLGCDADGPAQVRLLHIMPHLCSTPAQRTCSCMPHLDRRKLGDGQWRGTEVRS